MSAQHTFLRPDAGSGTSPILPKSTCSSEPGSPSATRSVVARARAADAEDLERIALQCAFGDDHSLAGQELGGLHCGQAIVDQPGLQLVMVGLEGRPGLPVPIAAVGPGLLADLGHELVVQSVFAGAPLQAGLGRGGNVALDGLSVQAHQHRDRACPFAA